MPYVQSEKMFLYSLHRGARSRGLQAKGDRELVPGLGKVSCGPSETLLSGGRDVCMCVFQGVLLPPKTAQVLSFYSLKGGQGRYMSSLYGVV